MTKVQLLEQISQEEIIKKYLPEFNPNSTKNYKSPFGKKDDKPSLSFFKSGNDWKFKSHNTGNSGDVFQFVADLYKLDTKKDFAGVINFITKDFGLNGFTVKPSVPAVSDKKKNIKISYEKAYTTDFLNYFSRFKIDMETLMRFKVYQVKYHEFISNSGKLCKFDYQKNKQVAVCFRVNERIKIYFPKIEGLQQKAFGFKDQTTDDIFGLAQLTAVDNLFIAAGEKDALALNSQGFAAVSFQSENHTPTKQQIDLLQSKAKSIFLVYDNDEAGIKASERITKLTGWKQIRLPKNFKDISEFFVSNTKEDFLKVISSFQKKELEKETGTDNFTIFHFAEKYLEENYDLRFNTVKLELECSRKGENLYQALNENDLFVEMNKRGIKIGMDKLIAILKSSFIERYNPLQEYFRNLPEWDAKTDHIGILASHLHSNEPKELLEQFTKWLVRCVRAIMVEGYYNKQAFILVHSKQNSGKTTFCRFLCPPALKDYMAENISDDKDSRIAIAKNFLINLDELSSLAKHEINSLKSLFSKDIINERLPYDRKNSIIHRVASFIGSTNMAEFLTDETGSVRWLCFEIKKIDWNYSQVVNINDVWAEAYALYREHYECDMNKDDIEENEKRNAKFQQLSTEAEMIPNFLKPADESAPNSEFMTATEVMMYLSSFTTLKVNRVMIGRAMPLCGFARAKHALTDRYGYWVIKQR